MITVFARKNSDRSISIFRDREAQNHFATFANYQSNRPRKTSRFVTLNCYKWRMEWIATP